MGAQFSSGPVVTDLAPLAGWSIDKVEGAFNSFRKGAENPFFVARADYRLFGIRQRNRLVKEAAEK